MDIFITMLSETYTLTVQPEDTVGYLKTVIQQKLGVPPYKQRLVFVNGQRTDLSEDAQTVRHYGLRSGSRVMLLVTEPATIQVFLRNDKGKMSTYDIKPDLTVDEFKRKVECRESVPVSQQRLVFQGREMSGGKLSDYKVQALSTIDLCLRLRGG
ncbi:polyubiquitin-like [Seriola dumerili]|uniref:ISG15 ubiquitin like modifier n=1 Tax=Seriola dumerili TaxID=41447 RepID=A0A3B4U6P7_SERDU|nr:polyubiquitin-like [Seriola dumerili]